MMGLIGFRVLKGTTMIGEALYSKNTDEWETPEAIYEPLNEEFHFTLDPCCTDSNAKCEKHYTREQDGLKQDWSGETVWCNPPYGRAIKAWVEKCAKHADEGGTAVMLLPSRTDTAWFHEYVLGKAEVRFVKGRIKFGHSKHSAPFPSIIVVFGRKEG